MDWLKAFHIISVVCWFAGLFYLPRLFVYHASTSDKNTSATFKTMEWKLFFYITTPSAVLTIALGWLMIFTNYDFYAQQMWLHIKLVLVLTLVFYHIYLGKLLFDFKHDRNKHGHKFYRYLNEYPSLVLIAVVILTIIKPFTAS